MPDLRDELLNAPEVPPDGGPPPPDDGPAGPPDTDGRPWGEIWAGCPVQPLGVSGDVSWYLDVTGQLRGVDNHTGQKMLHVFGGRLGLLAAHFPRFGKGGTPIPRVFDQGALSAAMIQACEERGVWQPTNKVRGPGCWASDTGELICHAGDAVLIGGTWQRPGLYGGHVYPASDCVPRPAEGEGRPDAARVLLEQISTWRWQRPDTDPQLMLGLILAQMLGGALDWRPVGWFTGDQATGKSTLQKLMLYVHGGPTGLLQAADATDAGIRSVVGYSSLPVAVDELEPDKDRPQKVKAVVELARRASSGAQIFRGSADQKGHQSNAYSCFLFSSILVAPMPAQDRSRLILLDLERFPEGAAKVKLDPRRLRAIGAELRALLVTRWPEWPERLEAWRAALAREGQTGRGADNYGTVLALADLALNPGPLSDEVLAAWAGKLGRAITEDALEVGSNAEDMLTHLLSQPLDVWRRGQKHTVAEWLMYAGRQEGAPEVLGEVADPGHANRLLAQFGLRVRGRQEGAELMIATKQLQGLVDLFRDTQWAGGAWTQAAGRLPGAGRGVPVTLNGIRSRATVVPFSAIPGLMSLPADREAAARSGPSPDDMEDFA